MLQNQGLELLLGFVVGWKRRRKALDFTVWFTVMPTAQQISCSAYVFRDTQPFPPHLAYTRPGWIHTEATYWVCRLIFGCWIKALPEWFSCRACNLCRLKWVIHGQATKGWKEDNFSWGSARRSAAPRLPLNIVIWWPLVVEFFLACVHGCVWAKPFNHVIFSYIPFLLFCHSH